MGKQRCNKEDDNKDVTKRMLMMMMGTIGEVENHKSVTRRMTTKM